MANEGLGGLVWDPRTLRYKNPGGDWNPGQGDNPNILVKGDKILFDVV